MKRCPQCEFVYEDDQSLCDMDGILLVFDSQKLPKPDLQASSVSPRPQARTRVFASLAALVLATVLYFVYNVSTRLPQSLSTPYSPATSTTKQNALPASEPASGATRDGAIEPHAPEHTIVSAEDTSDVVTPAKEARSGSPREANPTSEKQKTKPVQKSHDTTQPKENDSKLESVLKKTGRILKKPFKF